MPELNLRLLATAGGGHIGLGFVIQAFGVIVRSHLQSTNALTATTQQDTGFCYCKRSTGIYLDSVVLEVRMIKRWLVGDGHAVYDVPIWALLDLKFASN